MYQNNRVVLSPGSAIPVSSHSRASSRDYWKGGEIGVAGVGATVANAVFKAMGKRVRDLPITLDKVMERKFPAMVAGRKTARFVSWVGCL
jgi:hypothetical protein